MRTADKAKLRIGIGIFPDDGVVCLDALKLCIVDDIDLCALGDKALTLLDSLGSEVFDMVQADCAV